MIEELIVSDKETISRELLRLALRLAEMTSFTVAPA
jgi:hypothetical protein